MVVWIVVEEEVGTRLGCKRALLVKGGCLDIKITVRLRIVVP